MKILTTLVIPSRLWPSNVRRLLSSKNDELLSKLRAVNEKLVDELAKNNFNPKTPYRINVQTVAQHRIQVLLANPGGSTEQILKALQGNSLESLIQEGEDEFETLRQRVRDGKL
mmetsp:Transcript_10515/g.15041  ORF Transcript_10515/g.15041 Transcript_10515/m.15041 type:complete len:114 (+) Transcript_10515:592-933(+)